MGYASKYSLKQVWQYNIFVQTIRIEGYFMDNNTLPNLDYKVIAKLHTDKITLKLINRDVSSSSQAWEAEVSSLAACAEILPTFFDTLTDFYQHIQDPNNLRADPQAGVISVLLKTTIKNKQSLAQIARIRMSPSKNVDVKTMNLQNIVEICDGDEVLSNKMIKNFFKILAQQVLTPFQESKLDEILNPLINKFRIMGEENENFQRKLGGAFSEIAQIREINTKQVSIVAAEMRTSFEELKDYIETVKQGIDREIIRCENKYEIMSFEFKEKLEKVITQIKDEDVIILKLKQQISAIDQQIYDMQRQLYQKGDEDFKMVNKSQCFMDTSLPFFSHFKMEGSLITKKMATRGYSTMLIGKHSFDKREKFSIRIANLGMYPMYIGAIDGKHRSQQYCEKSDNRVWISSEGIIYDGERQRKIKYQFGKNATIEVVVNQGSGEIIWSFMDTKIPTQVKLLKNKDIKWYPCVWMGELGDAIQMKKNE